MIIISDVQKRKCATQSLKAYLRATRKQIKNSIGAGLSPYLMPSLEKARIHNHLINIINTGEALYIQPLIKLINVAKRSQLCLIHMKLQ